MQNIYTAEDYYLSGVLDTTTEYQIETKAQSFFEKEAKYSAWKQIQRLETLIGMLDMKIGELYSQDVVNYEVLDSIDYFSFLLYSQKQMLGAQIYCSSEQEKILPTADQEAKAEKLVLQMQDNTMSMIEEWFNTLIEEIEKSLSSEQSGDLSMDLAVDMSNFKLNADVDFNDYASSQDFLDSQTRGKLSSLIEVNEWEDATILNFSWMIDFIQKEGATFFNISEDELSWKNIEIYEDMYKMYTDFMKDNTYISIPADATTEEMLALIRGFNPQSMLADMKEIMKEPLFQVDEMQGNLYILVPTKYACDTWKALMKKFDPIFGSDTCSEWQYEKLVRDMKNDDFKMYLKDAWEMTQFGFRSRNNYDSASMEMKFDDNNIATVKFDVQPIDKSYDGFALEYTYKQDVTLSYSDEYMLLAGDIQLSDENSFKSMKISYDFEDEYSKSNGDFSMIDWKILWEMLVEVENTVLFSWNVEGTYDTNTASVTTSFSMDENIFAYMWEGNMNDWVSWELTFDFDLTDNKSNGSFFFDLLVWKKQIIDLSIENTGRIIYKKVNIEAPEKTITLEEVEEEIMKEAMSDM